MSKCELCGNEGVMVEIRGVYDGALYYLCPLPHREKGTMWAWHRWPQGTWQRKRAEAYVKDARGKASQA